MNLLAFMLGYTIARMLYVVVQGGNRVRAHRGGSGGGGNRAGALSNGVSGGSGGVRIAFDDVTPVVPYPS